MRYGSEADHDNLTGLSESNTQSVIDSSGLESAAGLASKGQLLNSQSNVAADSDGASEPSDPVAAAYPSLSEEPDAGTE